MHYFGHYFDIFDTFLVQEIGKISCKNVLPQVEELQKAGEFVLLGSLAVASC